MMNLDHSVRRTPSGSIDHDFYQLKAKQERSEYVGAIVSSTSQRLRFARSPLVAFALGMVVGAGALGGFTHHQLGSTSANIVSFSPDDLTVQQGPLRNAEVARTD